MMIYTVEVQAALCHPGPDLVVCDEGHIIKNDTTQISKALKNVTTKLVCVYLVYWIFL